MGTTRVSKTPTAASFAALAGVCSLLAGLSLAVGALAPEFPLTSKEIGSGEGEGPRLTVTWALIIGEDGVARCQPIYGD